MGGKRQGNENDSDYHRDYCKGLAMVFSFSIVDGLLPGPDLVSLDRARAQWHVLDYW
jgi:hypothetical protein